MSLRRREYSLEPLEQRMLLSGDGLVGADLLPTLKDPFRIASAAEVVVLNDRAPAEPAKSQQQPESNAFVDTTPAVEKVATETAETTAPAKLANDAAATPPASIAVPADPSVPTAASLSVETLTAGNGPPASGANESVGFDPPFGGFNFVADTLPDADALEDLFGGVSSSPVTFSGYIEKQDHTLTLTGSFTVSANGDHFEAAFTNVTGKLSAGGVDLNLTISEGAFTVDGDLATPATGGAAGFATITDASLTGVGGGNAFVFTLTDVSLEFNTTGAAAAADIDVSGHQVTFDYSDADELSFIRASGTMSLAITTSAVSVTLGGDFGFEIATVNGNSQVTFALSGGHADLTVGGVTLTASQLNGAFVIKSSGVAGWASVGAIAMTPSSSIFSFGELSNVSVNLNTTGSDITATIPVGSGSTGFTYSGSLEQNFFRVTGTVGLTVSQGSISTKLKGTLTFDRSVDTVTSAVILRVAAVNASSSFTAGSTTLDVTGINGAFIIMNSGFAGQASVAGITLTGVTGVTFNVTSLLFQINTTNSAVSASIATGGSPIVLDFTAPDRQQFLQVSGQVELALMMGGITASLNGGFYFEQFTLADSSKVVKFATLGATASFSAGSVTVTATDVSGGFIISQAGVAGFVSAADISISGITGVTATGSDIEFAINTTGAEAAASFTVGTDTIDFDYSDADELNFVSVGGTIDLGLTLGGVELGVSGSLAFQSGTLADGVTHVVKIGGEHLAADVMIGDVELSISEVEGIVVLTDAGAAGRVKIGSLSVVGVSGFTLSATDFAIEFNNTNAEVDEVLNVGAVSQTLSYSDPEELNFFRGSGTAAIGFSQGSFTTTLNGTFGFEQFTMPDSTSVLKFAFTDVNFEIAVSTAKLVINDADGFFLFDQYGYAGKLEISDAELQGVSGLTLTVQDFTFEVNTRNQAVEAEITRPGLPAFELSFTDADKFDFIALGGTLHIGIAIGSLNTTLDGTFYFEKANVDGYDSIKVSVTDASFTLSLSSSIGFAITDVNGAFLITDAGSAGKLSIGHVELTGISGLTFTVDDFNLEFNNTNSAVTADIPVPGGSPVSIDYSDSEHLDFIAVSGTLHLGLTIGSFSATLSGSFAFEKGPTSLKVGLQDVSFNLEVGTVAFEISDVDGAFAVYEDGLAAKLSIGHVELTGITGLTFTVDDFNFEFNNTGRDVTDTVTVGTGMSAELNFLAADGRDDFLAISGTLDLGLTIGSFSATLSGSFAFEKGTTSLKVGMQDVTFSLEVGTVAFVISDVDGAFAVYDDGLAAKLSIGHIELTGITGLTFTVDDFNFEFNNTGRDVTDTVTVGTGMSAELNFLAADGRDDFLAISGTLDLGLTIGSFSATLSGSFAFEKGTTSLKVGMQDVTFSLEVGTVAFVISDVDGAFAVYDDGLAAKLSIGHVELTGITGLTFTVDDFNFEFNNTGREVVDTVTVGTGMTADLNFLEADGKTDFLAIGGTLTLGLQISSFSGDLYGTFYVEKATIDGSEVFKVSVTSASFSVAFGSVVFSISQIDGAFLINDDGSAGMLSVGHASLTGISNVALDVSDFSIEFNNTGGPITAEIPVNDGDPIVLDYTDSNRFDFFRISGTIEVTISYVTLTATNVVVDTGATGTDHVFEAQSLAGTLAIPGMGSITVTAENLAFTAEGKLDNLAPGDLFIVSVDFGGTGQTAPGGDTFKWPTWLPIQISYLQLSWDDIGNHPEDFILVMSARLSMPAVAGLTFTGQVENLAIDVGKLVDGDFPIIGFDSAGVQVTGTLFGTLDVDAALVMGMIKLDADGNEITDPLVAGDETIFYAGLRGTAIVSASGIGGGFRIGLSEEGPLEAFITVAVPIVIEPVSGLTLGAFTAGIQFNQTLDDYSDPESLKAVTIASVLNPDISNWENDLHDATLRLHEGLEHGAGAAAWTQNMIITARAEFYSSYVSKQALDADVLIQVDTTGKILLIGELTMGGGNLKINAKFYADFTQASSGVVHFSFYADAGVPAAPGQPPFAIWGQLSLSILDDSGSPLSGDPDSPAELGGTTIKLALSGGERFTGAGVVTVEATGNIDIEIVLDDATSSYSVALSFNATVSLVNPPGNPLGDNFANIAGSVVLRILDAGGDIELYGAMKLTFSGQGLAQYGLDVDAEAFIQLNTTATDQPVTLTFTDGHTEDVTIRQQSFSIYIKGHVGLGTPADPTTHYLDMDGVLVLEVDANGLTLYLDVTVLVGPPGTPFLTFTATGFLRANASGIAAVLDMDLVSNLPEESQLEFGATFQLEFNTTEDTVTYETPAGYGPQVTITIPKSAPALVLGGTDLSVAADPSAPGEVYFVVAASGTVTALDSFALDGDFFVVITPDEFALAVDATLDLEPVGTVHAGGELHLSGDGAAGVLTADFSTGSALSSVGIDISGDFFVAFNTYGDDYELSDGTTLDAGLIRIEVDGSASLLSGAITMTGHFFFEQTPDHVTIEVNATMSMPVIGSITVDGFLNMTDDGAIGSLDATITSGSGLADIGITFSATLQLKINTTIADADDPLSSDPADIIEANTVMLDMDGSVTLMDAFTFVGHFYYKKSGSELTVKVDATLDVDVLGTFTADGFFTSDSTGYVAYLNLTLQSSPALESFGFQLTGTFTMGINTKPGTQTLPNGEDLGHDSLKIYVTGSLKIFNALELGGSFELVKTPTYIEIHVDATLDLYVLSLSVEGFAGIYSDGIVIDLSVNAQAFSLDPIFTATGNFRLQLNTTHGTVNGIQGNNYFHVAVTNLELSFLQVLTFEGSLDITYANGLFTLTFNVQLDLFGIVTIGADGYFNTDGDFHVHIHGALNLGSSGFGIFGSVDLSITGVAGSLTAISGDIDGSAKLFGITFASVHAGISWRSTDGRLRASVTISINLLFTTLHKTANFDLGYIKVVPPPNPAGDLNDGRSWSGGTLYVNTGTRAGYRDYSTEDTEEQVSITQSGTDIFVEVLGRKRRYSGVTGITVNLGDGDLDYVYVDPTVTVPVTINGGDGVDIIEYNGQAAAILNGDAGDDQITGGPNNDTISGGAGRDVLRGEGGVDTITGGTEDDVIEGGIGADILDAGDGDDAFVWSVGDGADSSILGGAGYDSLNMDGSSSANTLSVTTLGSFFRAAMDGVNLDTNSVEGVYADMKTGADTVTVADISSTVLSTVDVDFGSDSSADSLTIQGTGNADVYRLNSTSDLIVIAKVVSVSDTTSLIDYHVHGATYPADSITLNGGNGGDLIDAHNVVNALATLKLYGQDGADTVIGSSFNDTISGGDGDDTLTGGPGVDAFSDSSGDDTLVENLDVDFTLNGWQLTAGSDVETLPAVFETIRLNGGNSNNTFTISNAAAAIHLNGDEGSDVYVVNIAGAGTSLVDIADAGTGMAGYSNTNTLRIYGTSSPDDFLLRQGSIIAGNTSAHTETITFAGMSSFELHGGAGGDSFIVDETTVAGVIYGEAGEDNFTVGRILAPVGGTAPGDIATIATTRGYLAYGNIAMLELRGGDNDDTFEVNHNQAALSLYGEAGDDLFIIRTFLQEGSALSTVSGGTGSNSIQYVQNGPVFIDGGEGFDRLVVEGTEADDVFIITDQDIFGGGRKITFVNIESVVVLGGLGNDTFWVLGNGLPLEIDGGSGNDTINIGGQAPDYVYDAPETIVDPPAYTTYTPSYSAPVHVEIVIPAHFAFTSSFPFITWVPTTTVSFDFPPIFLGYVATVIDPPPTTYDPPAETYHFANVTNFNGVVNGVEVYKSANNTPVVPGPGVTPTSKYNLGTIEAPLKVTGGDDFGVSGEDDRMNVYLGGTTGDLTGALIDTIETFTDSDGTVTIGDPIGQLLGFGLPDSFSSEGRTFMGGITFEGLESAELNLGSGNDTLTIASTFDGVDVTVNGNNGNDTFNLQTSTGVVTLNGAAGTDSFNLGSNAPTITSGNLDGIDGGVTIDGGTGTDSLNLDDRGDTSDNVLTLGQTTIAGLDMAVGVTSYAGLESLLVGLGSGDDVGNIRGTSIPTTVQFNDGDDGMYVSSTAAVTNATRNTTTTLSGTLDDIDGNLTLEAGDGRHVLMVSDASNTAARGTSGSPAVLTGSSLTSFSTGTISYNASSTGNFADGITVWTGSGADVISVTGEFLRTGIRNSTSLNTGAGGDAITVALADSPYGFVAVHAGSGNDTIDATSSALGLVLFGGDGADVIEASLGDNIVFGDEGSVSYVDGLGNLAARYGSGGLDDFTDGVVRAAASAVTVFSLGADADTITTGSGNDVILGGGAGDSISAFDGDNLIFGDSGVASLSAGVPVLLQSLLVGGGDDTVTAGSGRDLVIGGTGADIVNAGAGHNVVLGDHGLITLSGNIVTSVSTTPDSDGGVDVITTLGGNDFILGGEAGDMIGADEGDNTVFGDHGSVTLSGGLVTLAESDLSGGGGDTVTAGSGRDLVIAGTGADTVDAGAGDNVVLGDHGTIALSGNVLTSVSTSPDADGGIDVITTLGGNDFILGGEAGDMIGAGEGDNTVFGDHGSVTLSGGLVTLAQSNLAGGGDDTIAAGPGRDLVIAGAGGDGIEAGAGDNVVLGDHGAIALSGNIVTSVSTTPDSDGGVDVITTLGGNDFILGGEAGDMIGAGEGDNTVFGDHGSVTLSGGLVTLAQSNLAGGGDDTITAGSGRDLVIAGTGGDGIEAGAGDNVVLGDHGTIALSSNVVTSVTTTPDSDGGVDTITTLGGNDFILGGEAGDTIDAGDGRNAVAGDLGVFTLPSATALTFAPSEVLTGGADTITTGSGADTVIGGFGADEIDVGDGRNVLFGDTGTINRDFSDNSLTAASTDEATGGDDLLTSGSDRDVIVGGAGSDTVAAGEDDNIIFGDSGAITITGDLPVSISTTGSNTGAGDSLAAGSGSDVLLGGDGADTILAGEGDNVVLGDAGSIAWSGSVLSIITAAADSLGGADTITSGAGNDIVLGGNAGDTVNAGNGDNAVIGDQGTITFTAGMATTLANAPASGDGDDSIDTGAGDDVVLGGNGADTVAAGTGDNTVAGDNATILRAENSGSVATTTITSAALGAGAGDSLTTGGGNDWIVAGAGNDSVDAGTGKNVVLGDEGAVQTASFIVSVVESTGGAYADVITTGDGDDIVAGGGGADTIVAGEGANAIVGDHGSITLESGVLSTVETSTLAGADDSIQAGSGYNLIAGGLGADHITVSGGTSVVLGDQGRIDVAGATLLSATTSNAGTGTGDIIVAGDGQHWVLAGDGDDSVSIGNGFAAVFGDSGRIDRGGDGTLTITSSDFATGGADAIATGAGSDIIVGGSGSDTIDAGEGDNVVLGDHGTIVAAPTGLVSVASAAPGEGAADVITTGDGNDIIIGGAGADVVHAGGGRNLVLGDLGSFTFNAGVLSLATSSDYTIGGDDTIDTGIGDDLIVAGLGSDTVDAGEGDNVVLGDQGSVTQSGGVIADAVTVQASLGAADIIATGSGDDVVLGGLGTDHIVAGDGENLVLGDHGEFHWLVGILARALSTDYAAGGSDAILTGAGSDIIIAGPDDDTVDAGDGDNIVFGDSGSIEWTAGIIRFATTDATDVGGDDSITAATGNDTIFGGTGDDTVVAGDGNNVVFGDNGEAEYVAGIRARFATTAPEDADSDTITSGIGDDTILAGAGSDTVTIAGGDNVVFGDEAEFTYDGAGVPDEAISIAPAMGAADTVTTGGGDDLIVGGFGQDTINGGDGDNVVFGDNGDAQYAGGLAVLFQTLTPENSASDTITTGGGRDFILGGAGADTISAGDGADVVLGDEGVFTLSAGTLAAVESEAYSEGAADTITGQGGNDAIVGGAGGDFVDGGEGDNVIFGDNALLTFPGGILSQAEVLAPVVGGGDTIVAGAGQDVIVAGTGDDVVDAGNGDNVVAGDHATLGFSGGQFATLTPTTTELGGADTITAGAGSDVIIAGMGADRVDAGDGDNLVAGDHASVGKTGGLLTRVESVSPADGGIDLVFTGSGNDLVIGGTSGDTIHSGAGNDLVFGDQALVTGSISLALLPLASPVKPFTFTAIITQNVDGSGRPLGGDDVVIAGSGDDIVFGQQGDDVLSGGEGDDDLIGGHNVAGGQDGSDVIDGGAGYDVIAGDNAAVLRRGDNVSPRAHVLEGTAMFDDRGRLLDVDAPQAWPTAVPERSIVILDHAFDTDVRLWSADDLVGGAGDDVVFGELGNDRIHGDATLSIGSAADGLVDRAAVRSAANALFTTSAWQGADSDGDDYLEGNGGDDLIFGGLGQDDIVGGSSALFGLTDRLQRPDGADTIYGGNGTAAGDEDLGDGSLDGRARDADVILGDNGNIFRLVGINGVNGGSFLAFSYDTMGSVKIIVRAFDLLDYTVPDSPNDIGTSDRIYGEAGDDTLHGEVGGDSVYGNGQDDNLYGGQGDDDLFGGGGDDSLSGGDELHPPPPADNGAVDGNGAEGTAPGTVIFTVPSNFPAGIQFGPDAAAPQYVAPRPFYLGFLSSGSSTPAPTSVFGSSDSAWRVFSSGMVPSTSFDLPDIFLSPPGGIEGFDEMLN